MLVQAWVAGHFGQVRQFHMSLSDAFGDRKKPQRWDSCKDQAAAFTGLWSMEFGTMVFWWFLDVSWITSVLLPDPEGHLPPLHDSHEVRHVKRPEGLPCTPEDRLRLLWKFPDSTFIYYSFILCIALCCTPLTWIDNPEFVFERVSRSFPIWHGLAEIGRNRRQLKTMKNHPHCNDKETVNTLTSKSLVWM